MRTILITGAGGFFGRHAAKHFATLGCFVIGLGRTSRDQSFLAEWGISEWLTTDLTSGQKIPPSKKPDAIIHCAGSSDVGRSAARPDEDFRDSVLSLQAILEYSRKLEYDCKLIYLSSAAVYGTAHTLPIRETDVAAPISIYGLHKSVCEQLVHAHAAHFGLNASIIRFFSIYGPGLRKQIFWDASRKALAKESHFFGTGRETRDFLHIDDAVRLIEAALENTSVTCPIINGGSGEATTIEHVVSSIFAALGAEVRPLFANKKRTGDPKDYLADITRATEWGWSMTYSIEDGILEYADWIKSLPPTEILGN